MDLDAIAGFQYDPALTEPANLDNYLDALEDIIADHGTDCSCEDCWEHYVLSQK